MMRFHSQLMWAEPDVIGLFSSNVGSFSFNAGQSEPIFSGRLQELSATRLLN